MLPKNGDTPELNEADCAWAAAALCEAPKPPNPLLNDCEAAFAFAADPAKFGANPPNGELNDCVCEAACAAAAL